MEKTRKVIVIDVEFKVELEDFARFNFEAVVDQMNCSGEVIVKNVRTDEEAVRWLP